MRRSPWRCASIHSCSVHRCTVHHRAIHPCTVCSCAVHPCANRPCIVFFWGLLSWRRVCLRCLIVLALFAFAPLVLVLPLIAHFVIGPFTGAPLVLTSAACPLTHGHLALVCPAQVGLGDKFNAVAHLRFIVGLLILVLFVLMLIVLVLLVLKHLYIKCLQ